MQLTESSIYINLKRLRNLLYEAQFRMTTANKVVFGNTGKEKARSFNRCVRESKTDSLLASLNSYLGICKGVNGYRQALSIVRELSSEWNKYVEFDRHRCCLVARDSNRNRIIKKFNLK